MRLFTSPAGGFSGYVSVCYYYSVYLDFEDVVLWREYKGLDRFNLFCCSYHFISFSKTSPFNH